MSRYPIPWIATYFLAALALIVGAIAVGWVLEGTGFDYDGGDPDFAYLERIVLSGEPRRGDFSGLNVGDWQVLCLVGAGANLGAALDDTAVPPAQAGALRAAFDADPPVLHETEFVLAYITRGGATRLLRHPHGFAFVRRQAAACTLRDQPVLRLPAGG